MEVVAAVAVIIPAVREQAVIQAAIMTITKPTISKH
jgi:hypothetical protein